MSTGRQALEEAGLFTRRSPAKRDVGGLSRGLMPPPRLDGESRRAKYRPVVIRQGKSALTGFPPKAGGMEFFEYKKSTMVPALAYSPRANAQVPSALTSLTSVFGMGTGMASSLKAPEL